MKKQEELYSFPQQNDGAVVETDIRMIPLSELHDFNGHPFKVENDMALFELMQSIEKEGVVVPALARPREDGGYELIAGHRRKAACKWAGLNCMPVVVRDLDDNQAVIAMVDSNLQREHLKPSEKAFAYKMKLEAIKRQGARTDLTFCQVGEKITSSQVGKKLSSSQIVTGTSDQDGTKLENPTLQTHSLTSEHDADGKWVLLQDKSVGDEMFVKHYICPFTDYEVLLYLLKYYKLNFRKIFRGKQVIKKSSNIMARPLLLSYIDDIVNEHEEYEYAYQIYKTLIGKWIDREVHFIQKTSEKDIAISDYINNFWQFIYDIVELMLQGAENGNIYSVSSQDLERLCSKYTIDLDIDKRSRTLLNRVGDDIFQFSHQSIFEFLLADGIRNGAVRLNDENSGISALDQYKLFIQEMYENQLLNKVVASESLIILNLVTPLLVDNIEQDVHISCVLADPFMKKIIFRLESATQLIDAITVGNLKEISEKIKSYDFSQYNLFWLSDGNFPKTVRVNAVLFYEAKVSINNRNLFGRILFDMEKARIVIETSENVHVPYWDINMFIDDMPVNVILEFVNEQSSIADNHGNKVLVLKTCCQCLDIEVSLHDLGG